MSKFIQSEDGCFCTKELSNNIDDESSECDKKHRKRKDSTTKPKHHEKITNEKKSALFSQITIEVPTQPRCSDQHKRPSLIVDTNFEPLDPTRRQSEPVVQSHRPHPRTLHQNWRRNHGTSSENKNRRYPRRTPSPAANNLSPGYEQYQKSLLEVPWCSDYGDASSDDLSSEWDSDVPEAAAPTFPKVSYLIVLILN
jgi:hypothetical protein